MRRIGLALLSLSLVLGLVALWGLRSISGAHAAPPPAPARAEPRTTVVVASRPIGFGETLTAADLREQPWPADVAPPGAYRTVAEITSGAPRTALGPIAANEPIVPMKLSGPGGRASLSSQIRPGMRAAAIRVDDVMGVAGFVLPGDFVDVVVTRGDDAKAARADVLLQDVRVLAIDQTASSTKSDPILAKAATIEVTPAQAAKLALAGHVGSLSLALRGAAEAGAASPGPSASVRTADLSAGGGVARPRLVRTGARRAAPSGPDIKVYRGVEPTKVAVRFEQ